MRLIVIGFGCMIDARILTVLRRTAYALIAFAVLILCAVGLMSVDWKHHFMHKLSAAEAISYFCISTDPSPFGVKPIAERRDMIQVNEREYSDIQQSVRTGGHFRLFRCGGRFEIWMHSQLGLDTLYSVYDAHGHYLADCDLEAPYSKDCPRDGQTCEILSDNCAARY